MKFGLKHFIVAVFSLGIVSFSFADEEALNRLFSARSLKCTLGEGASGDWKGGKLEVRKGKWKTVLHFDNINIKAGTARLIGNQGSEDVTVTSTNKGVTFVELTFTGNLNFTTVFASYKKGTSEFIMVTSRHMDLMGAPLPSQYHGTCKVWD